MAAVQPRWPERSPTQAQTKVEVVEDGKRYVAEVHEVDGLVTIYTDAVGKKSTGLGGGNIASVARHMLKHLICSGNADPLVD